MSLTISAELLAKTTCEPLAYERKRGLSWNERECYVNVGQLSDADLEDIKSAATEVKDGKVARAIESIQLARSGQFDKPIPSFKAFEGILTLFFKANLKDGWIYVQGPDGKMYPMLLTKTIYDDGRSRNGPPEPYVKVDAVFFGMSDSGGREKVLGLRKDSFTFTPNEVTKRRPSDILAAKGIYLETDELRAEYDATMKRHAELIQPFFAEQFRFTGAVYRYNDGGYSRRGQKVHNRKVIHDIEGSDYAASAGHADSVLFPDSAGEIPEHPLLRVFDLGAHEFYWVNSDFMTPYVYDKSLKDKLVLPQTHRDLLDVLTTDLESFTQDIIENKSAGNIILSKGLPGVGKTLTAEVYSELIERPLYAIHSGTLGTKADAIEKSLKEIMQRAKRWNAVLLLDEADVFVMKRGNSIELNAIVAEFLRTLEYFDGLMFMTTNRPDDIDDAIISRCLAIIEYNPPIPDDARRIWAVMGRNFGVELDPNLIDRLLTLFPQIVGRDIKMLLKLVLRMRKDGAPLEIDQFRKCAMFRAIHMETKDAV